jgi:hypothetical protein
MIQRKQLRLEMVVGGVGVFNPVEIEIQVCIP